MTIVSYAWCSTLHKVPKLSFQLWTSTKQLFLSPFDRDFVLSQQGCKRAARWSQVGPEQVAQYTGRSTLITRWYHFPLMYNGIMALRVLSIKINFMYLANMSGITPCETHVATGNRSCSFILTWTHQDLTCFDTSDGHTKYMFERSMQHVPRWVLQFRTFNFWEHTRTRYGVVRNITPANRIIW